jgi:hypothetical protein
MKRYQDPATGQEWQLDDALDIKTAPNLPANLTEVVIDKPPFPCTWDSVTKAWAVDLTAAIAASIAAVEAFHAKMMLAYTANPTVVALASYTAKAACADAIIANTALTARDTAYLTKAGISTAAAKTAWANTVLAKSLAFNGLLGAADGLASTAKARLAACTTLAQLTAAITQNSADANALIATLPKV